MRIERQDEVAKQFSSYWFDNLQQGACISVFNFLTGKKSIVNLYAASPCIILFLRAKDFEELTKENIDLNDRVKLVKMSVEKNLLSDIDYFTFPKRHLLSK